MKTKICAALAVAAIISFSALNVSAEEKTAASLLDNNTEEGCDIHDENDVYDPEAAQHNDYPIIYGESTPADDEGRILYYDEDDNLYFPDRDGNKYYLLFEDGRGRYYLSPDGNKYFHSSKGYSYADEEGNKHYVNRDGYYWLYDKDSEVWYYLDSEGNKYLPDEKWQNYFFVDENGNKHYPNFDKDRYYPVVTSLEETADISDKTDIAAEPNPKTGNNGFPAAAVTACALAAAALLKAKENLK